MINKVKSKVKGNPVIVIVTKSEATHKKNPNLIQVKSTSTGNIAWVDRRDVGLVDTRNGNYELEINETIAKDLGLI